MADHEVQAQDLYQIPIFFMMRGSEEVIFDDRKVVEVLFDVKCDSYKEQRSYSRQKMAKNKRDDGQSNRNNLDDNPIFLGCDLFLEALKADGLALILSDLALAEFQNIDKAEENPKRLHGHIELAPFNLLEDEGQGEDEDIEKYEKYPSYDQNILYYFRQVNLLDALNEFALRDFKLIFVGVILNGPAVYAVEAQLLEKELDQVADPDYLVNAARLAHLAGVRGQ